MKKRMFFYSMLFGVMFSSFIKNINQGVIELVYTGDPTKPFPVIIFYLPGSVDTNYDSTYVHKYEISEEGFNNLRRSLCVDLAIKQDTILNNPYQITIIKNGESSVFSTCHLKRINKIFELILEEYKFSSNEKKISDVLKSVMNRLRYESHRRQ